MRRQTLIDHWADEYVMCGYPQPITRRQAMANMIGDGMTATEAAHAIAWYKAVSGPESDSP